MSGLEITLTVISILGTLSSISFGYLAFKRNSSTDTKQLGRESGTVISDLGYIKSSIERIEKRLDNSESKFDSISTRLARVEESVSSAHKRIDEHITKRIGGKKSE
jgi:predicted  nucleic acid-binding Zn-ribbon protein